MQKSTKQNLRNCLVYGLLLGLFQGVIIATARCLLGNYHASANVAYFSLIVHPIVFTSLVLLFTLAMIVRRIFSRDLITNQLIAKNFLSSIIAVALVYVLSQCANLSYLVLAATRSKHAHTAIIISQAFNCVNSFANFFIYLLFSKSFRRTFRRSLISMGWASF